jgi:hypothetical protein
VGELFVFGKSEYGKEAEDSGYFSSIMALRRRTMANAPNIMVTDRWYWWKTRHSWYWKTRQLATAGERAEIVGT